MNTTETMSPKKFLMTTQGIEPVPHLPKHTLRLLSHEDSVLFYTV